MRCSRATSSCIWCAGVVACTVIAAGVLMCRARRHRQHIRLYSDKASDASPRSSITGKIGSLPFKGSLQQGSAPLGNGQLKANGGKLGISTHGLLSRRSGHALKSPAPMPASWTEHGDASLAFREHDTSLIAPSRGQIEQQARHHAPCHSCRLLSNVGDYDYLQARAIILSAGQH